MTNGWLVAAATLALALSNGAIAQSVYKCPGPNGVPTYTDRPCPDGAGTVIHKASAEEQAAHVRMQQADNVRSMIRQGHYEEAQSYAAAHGIGDVFENEGRAELLRQQAQSDAIEQAARDAQGQRERAMANRIDQLQMENQTLQESRNQAARRAQDAEQEAKKQKRAATHARASAASPSHINSAPTFNPQTGQWCQVNAGVLNCW